MSKEISTKTRVQMKANSHAQLIKYTRMIRSIQLMFMKSNNLQWGMK